MKTILTLTALALLLPTTAQGWVHHMRVPAGEVTEWQTPQWFLWSDNTVFKVKVNGHVLDATYKYERKRKCAIGWSARQAAVEAQMRCHKRGPVTIEAANLRDRTIRVRVSYWDPTRPSTDEEVAKAPASQ